MGRFEKIVWLLFLIFLAGAFIARAEEPKQATVTITLEELQRMLNASYEAGREQGFREGAEAGVSAATDFSHPTTYYVPKSSTAQSDAFQAYSAAQAQGAAKQQAITESLQRQQLINAIRGTPPVLANTPFVEGP